MSRVSGLTVEEDSVFVDIPKHEINFTDLRKDDLGLSHGEAENLQKK
jgi:hypothetical protein